jgi:hypothetical protein
MKKKEKILVNNKGKGRNKMSVEMVVKDTMEVKEKKK